MKNVIWKPYSGGSLKYTVSSQIMVSFPNLGNFKWTVLRAQEELWELPVLGNILIVLEMARFIGAATISVTPPLERKNLPGSWVEMETVPLKRKVCKTGNSRFAVQFAVRSVLFAPIKSFKQLQRYIVFFVKKTWLFAKSCKMIMNRDFVYSYDIYLFLRDLMCSQYFGIS